MLMAGLVGLTLGLFIGWWVWPVQWIDAPATAPATMPAAAAPAQSVETPAAENRSSESNYSALMDWVNQGLLYVAAALLLVGGVVIGYQLLRQSQDKDSKESPFPLPFSRNRSNQATAARDRRAKSPPLSGRPVRPRQPTLNWLRRETESESPATAEEPVFREQSVAGRRTGERSPISRMPDSESSRQETQSTKAESPWIQPDDTLSPEPWTDREAGASIAPQERPVEAERRPGSPVSHAAPEAAIQGGDDGKDGDRQSTPSEAAIPEILDGPETGADAGVDTAVPAGGFAGREAPAEREEQGMESSPFPILEPEPAETLPAQAETGPATHTSRKLVGQFEANYAFGIQTYDESFTINAADGELLGACGMGINESVDRAAANSDQVRLLDIWLYDRSAVRSVSQPLVSPGFDVSGLDDFADGSGSDSSPPLVVGPGLTCTLQSDHIVLECTIKSATFLDGEQAPVPFRSVSASLAIYLQT